MGSTPKDKDLKIFRGYRDPDSIVFADGREWLRGSDWTKRKREAAARARGRCENILFDIDTATGYRCFRDGRDAHHQVKRSVLRDDRLENLLWVCRTCHELLDNRKIRSDRAERARNNEC